MKASPANSQVARQFWKDKAFALALLAGPACWLLLYLLGQPVSGPPELLFWLKLSLLMPVLEEIVFRGGIQAALHSKAFFKPQFFGISLANVVTSIVFTAMHFLSQPPSWAILVFLPSLVFGWARDRYLSVVPCILLHGLYNAGFVWLFVGPV